MSPDIASDYWNGVWNINVFISGIIRCVRARLYGTSSEIKRLPHYAWKKERIFIAVYWYLEYFIQRNSKKLEELLQRRKNASGLNSLRCGISTAINRTIKNNRLSKHNNNTPKYARHSAA